MEWIKRMDLKRALFTLTFLSLATAALLSALSFWGCLELRSAIAPEGSAVIIASGSITVTELPGPSPGADAVINVLSALQLLLPVLFFILALLSTVSLFYRWKLQEPLAVLSEGAAHMIAHDLDFSVPTTGSDELGQLCVAFETMRRTLLRDHRELWRQAEERRRLNAAFSHDLRNPVTVLKGSAKLAAAWAERGEEGRPQLMEHLARIEAYTGRIERYVEAMSAAGRLEQIPLEPAPADPPALARELEQAVRLIAASSGKYLIFQWDGGAVPLCLDQSILFQVAENLVSNALRFARTRVAVCLSRSGGQLTLSVEDDGGGFPPELLSGGVRPFQTFGREGGHFGMGLYLCDLLCRKHGGALTLENTEAGALARAVFGSPLP